MILALLLASERTTTQLRETDLTHRRDAGDVVVTDLVAGGFAVTAGGFDGALGSVVGPPGDSTRGRTIGGLAADGVSVGEATGLTVSRTAPAELTMVRCSGGAFVGAAGTGAGAGAVTGAEAGRCTTVSAAAAESAAALAAATLRARGVAGGSLSCSSQAVPTMAITPAAAAPLQMWGPMGGRSGCVPHHLHAPTLSG
jgi:hypothetical protein